MRKNPTTVSITDAVLMYNLLFYFNLFNSILLVLMSRNDGIQDISYFQCVNHIRGTGMSK